MKIKRCGEYTNTISPKEIFGSFIEQGYGRQVPGLWAEMIYNRSFREIPDYKFPTISWRGLDKEHYGPEAKFWHSGYEENNWYNIGNPKTFLTLGEETHRGKHSLTIRNKTGERCGVAQNGIHIQAGRSYTFEIFCGVATGIYAMDPNLDLMRHYVGMDIRPQDERVVEITIGANKTVINGGGDPKPHKWTFCAEKDEVCTISITFDWAGDFIIAYTSLMPDDNLRGWRKEIVELIRQIAPPVVRFPGGCFTSFYDWKSAIGPRNEREPQESYYWGGLVENDVGLAEFMDLAELCGFEPQICFNMQTSDPFDARCMVEYLNAPANVGYGRKRMLDGHPEPWNVRLFECDNESARKWNPIQYANKCVEFAREMRLAYPAAEFMMGLYYENDTIEGMLDIAGNDINYVLTREFAPKALSEILSIVRSYNQKSGRNIRLVNTEWLSSTGSPEPYDVSAMGRGFSGFREPHNDYARTVSPYLMSWNYALNVARDILTFLSMGGELCLVNFNNLANTFGQNQIEAAKDGAWLSCAGEVFAFFHRCFEPCYSAKAETEDELVEALFTRNNEGTQKLYVINRDSSEKEYILPEGFTGALDGLSAPCRSAHVTQTNNPVSIVRPVVTEGKVVIPPLSVVCFV